MTAAMPARFEELAVYNRAMSAAQIPMPVPAELADVVVQAGGQITCFQIVEADRSQYSEEYHARMAELQADYDRWIISRLHLDNPGAQIRVDPTGGVLIIPAGVLSADA